MSTFTNPAQGTQEETDAYMEAVLGLLGDQDPMAVLERFLEEVRRTVAGLSEAQLRAPEAPGKWSIVEVLQHLVDAELVWAVRLRMALGGDAPRLTSYDQDAWATRLRYQDASPDEALALLEALRTANLRLLRSLTPPEWRRVAVHEERGEESVERMVRHYAGHDLVHRRQLRRIRDVQTTA